MAVLEKRRYWKSGGIGKAAVLGVAYNYNEEEKPIWQIKMSAGGMGGGGVINGGVVSGEPLYILKSGEKRYCRMSK